MSKLRYFWYIRPESDWPPPTIRDPEELTGGDCVSLGCTQTSLSASAQRKLVNRWCDLLPGLDEIRYLWLTTRTPQHLFDAACQMKGLRGLWVKWSGLKSIDALAGQQSLEALHIGSSPSVPCIEVLSELHSLSWLGLENFKKVSALDAIRELTSLEGLSVGGDMWTTQHVDTLEPIGKLENLRFLALANLRAADRTLEPLFSLRKLESFFAAQWWDAAEVETLMGLNPGLSA